MLGRHKEAIDNYNIAISKNPDNAIYYCHKGSHIKLLLADSLKSLNLFEDAIIC